MALSFTGGVGNLFPRLGKVALLLKQVRSFQNSQNTNLIDTTNGLVAQLNGESDIQAVVGSAYIGQLNSAGDTTGSFASNVAQQIVSRMVFRDSPRAGQDLQSQNTLASLQEIIRQMKAQGASVLAMTIAATPTIFTGTGNGVVVASVRRPLDGLVLENTFAETITLVCSGDSILGGGTAGNEPFQVTGQGAQSDAFAFNWPLGSGASTALSAIDGSKDNASGNLLTNSGFDLFTGSVPNKWVLDVGAAVTNTARETSLTFSSGSALRIIGDGTTLVRLAQSFNASTGTLGTLAPLTQYGVNLWMRRDATAPAAGAMVVELTDGTGNVIGDANGLANSFTIDLTNLSTTYTSYSGVFRTPIFLPASQRIRLRQTTALTNNRQIYLDDLSLGLMSQVYTSGPSLSVHAGSTPFLTGDFATVSVTNSRGAAGTIDTFQTAFARLFPQMIGSELLLPSAAAPSLSDGALIA